MNQQIDPNQILTTATDEQDQIDERSDSFSMAAEEEKDIKDQQLKQAELDKMYLVLDKIESTEFGSLQQKVTPTQLSKIVNERRPATYKSIVDLFILDEHFFTSNFVGPGEVKTIDGKTKEKIIDLLASLAPNSDPNQILVELKKVNSGLVLPDNFQIDIYQPRAVNLKQGSQNIKKIIVEVTYNEYLGDVLLLVSLPIEKIKNLKLTVETLSAKMAQEYKKILLDQEPLPSVIDEALVVLGDVGRTPIFINDLKEKNNFGSISEIILKLVLALDIVVYIREKHSNQIPENEIIEEIKNYLFQDIILF